VPRATERLRLTAYAGGALSSALLYQTFGTYIGYFYIDVLRLPAAAVGGGMVAFGIWNAANDLLVGYLSDRTRTRWGRRRPYMFLGTLPLVVLFGLVWAPPDGLGTTGLFVWFMVAVFLFDLGYTAVILNWAALFPEVAPDLERRATLAAVRHVFRIAGTIAAVAGPPLAYSTIGWGPMGMVFGAVAAAFLAVAAWGARERPEASAGRPLDLWPALGQTLGNRAFAALMVASIAVNFTYAALSAAFPFYTKYVLGASDPQTSILFAVIFLVALPALGLWGRMATRWGTRAAALAAVGAFALALAPFAVARGFVDALAIAIPVGLSLAGLMMTLDLLLAEVVDADAVRTGLRREGMYYGVNGVLIRLGTSLQAGVMGFCLTWSGYDPALGAGGQPAAALGALRFLLTGLPALAMAVAALGLLAYPLGARTR